MGIPRKEAKQIKMLSATRACLLMALLGVAVDAAVMPRQLSPLKSGRGSAMRLISKIENDGDDVDQHGDPDAVVVGDDQKTERALSCQQLKNLSLRGGGDAATVLPEGEKLQVVFVSAEIAPWSITGGLGAVCDGLPRAMAKLGHRVMSIAPRYDQYYDAWDTEFTAEVPMGDEMTTVRFFHAFKKGVDRVFVDHPLFLEKVWGQTKQKLYGPKWGKDYEDNQLRFAMFCKAAMVATEKLSLGGFPYGQDVTFVANDWHAALLPKYIKVAKEQGTWQNARVATLLHNMVFQGRFPYDPKAASRLHLPQSMVDQFKITQPLKVGKQKVQTKGLKGTEEIPNPAVECLNFILGGVLASDSVLTVSPGYAREIVNDPSKSCELEKELASVKGILNGVEDIVDPSNPELGLDIQYDAQSLEKKIEGKMSMQKSLGFAVSGETPMFVFMGRLDAQKGVDIMFDSIDAALFKGVEKYKPYAAADFALMPSRYEPCGLVQMEGMRFGTLPIVAPTGGLTDTVTDGKTGIVMEHEIDQDGIETEDVAMLAKSIERAATLHKSGSMKTMQVEAMEAADKYSWANSAKQYVQTFSALRA